MSSRKTSAGLNPLVRSRCRIQNCRCLRGRYAKRHPLNSQMVRPPPASGRTSPFRGVEGNVGYRAVVPSPPERVKMPQPGHCTKLAQAAIAGCRALLDDLHRREGGCRDLGLHSLHDDDTVILAFVPMLARVLIRRALVPSLCLGEAAEFQDCNTLDTPPSLTSKRPN